MKKTTVIALIIVAVLLSILVTLVVINRYAILDRLFTVEVEWYKVPDEFVRAEDYSAQRGRFLGYGAGLTERVYELDWMLNTDYLYITRRWFTGPPASTGVLYMNPSAPEPIFLFDVYKIEINPRNFNQVNEESTINADEVIVIEDHQVISEWIAFHENGYNIVEEEFLVNWDDALTIDGRSFVHYSIRFYFDLPSELVWHASIYHIGNQAVYMRAFHVASERRIVYDVTELLSPFMNH